jgi:hypothetical protein
MSRGSYTQVRSGLLVGCVAFMVLASSASAEPLNFTCASADSSDTFRVTTDLSSDLISNEGGQSGRRWAAHVTDKDVTWDEIYDLRRGHVANHFVLDRTTGSLHGADMATSSEIMSAVCQKAS